MAHRRGADVPFQVRADAAGDAVRRRNRRSARLADAAVLAGVDVDDVAAPCEPARGRAPGRSTCRRPSPAAGLAADAARSPRNRRRASAARPGRCRQSARLLMQAMAVSPSQPQLASMSRADVRSDGLADRTDAGSIVAGVAADLHLDRVEARRPPALGRRAGRARDRRRPSRSGSEPARPHSGRRAARTPACPRPCPDVPAGHLDGGLGEPVVPADRVHPAVNLVDGAADRSRAQRRQAHGR